MTDVALYGAMAGVAAITTGVQAAVSLPVAAFAWRDTKKYKSLSVAERLERKDGLKATAVACLMAVLAAGAANAASLAGWYLAVPADAEIMFVLPVLGVTGAALLCGIPAAVATARYMWAVFSPVR